MLGAGIHRGGARDIEVERIGKSGGDAEGQADGQGVFDLRSGDTGGQHRPDVVDIN